MRIVKYIVALLVVLLGLLALGYAFLPWQSWAENWIGQRLRAQGIPVSGLSLKQLTPTHLDFSEVTIDLGSPLVIPTLRVHYTYENLMQQQLDKVELRDIHYVLKAETDTATAPEDFAIPAPALLQSLPVAQVSIANSQFEWQQADGSVLHLPFEAEISPQQSPLLQAKGESASLSLADGSSAYLKQWHATATADESEPQWQLSFSAETIEASNSSGKFSAPLQVKTTLNESPSITLALDPASVKIDKQHYQLFGLKLKLDKAGTAWKVNAELPQLKQSDEEEVIWLPLAVSAKGENAGTAFNANINAKHRDFNLNTALRYDGKTTQLQNSVLKVAGGTVTAKTLKLQNANLASTLVFDNVSLEELLQLMLKDNQSVQATGRLSGAVPIALKEGVLSFGDGELHSLAKGFVSLGEQHLGALPQNVEHVKQVGELLKHFEYDSLTLRTVAQNGKLGVTIALKGRNPQVYEGAEVHLNINLRGDVLETITSALGLYELPQRYLKGVQNAK